MKMCCDTTEKHQRAIVSKPTPLGVCATLLGTGIADVPGGTALRAQALAAVFGGEMKAA